MAVVVVSSSGASSDARAEISSSWRCWRLLNRGGMMTRAGLSAVVEDKLSQKSTIKINNQRRLGPSPEPAALCVLPAACPVLPCRGWLPWL
jgi:hypothetical protein